MTFSAQRRRSCTFRNKIFISPGPTRQTTLDDAHRPVGSAHSRLRQGLHSPVQLPQQRPQAPHNSGPEGPQKLARIAGNLAYNVCLRRDDVHLLCWGVGRRRIATCLPMTCRRRKKYKEQRIVRAETRIFADQQEQFSLGLTPTYANLHALIYCTIYTPLHLHQHLHPYTQNALPHHPQPGRHGSGGVVPDQRRQRQLPRRTRDQHGSGAPVQQGRHGDALVPDSRREHQRRLALGQDGGQLLRGRLVRADQHGQHGRRRVQRRRRQSSSPVGRQPADAQRRAERQCERHHWRSEAPRARPPGLSRRHYHRSN